VLVGGGLCYGAGPIEDEREAEFVALHGADDELMGREGVDVQQITVGAEHGIGHDEADAFVAVDEGVIVAERF
jgi:hypothetical protein